MDAGRQMFQDWEGAECVLHVLHTQLYILSCFLVVIVVMPQQGVISH